MQDSGNASSARKLAAIMFTDIVGYTALMGRDTQKALDVLRTNRNIQKPLIEKYRGKWLKEMGDGVLAQFDSAIDSVQCAHEIQRSAMIKLDGKIRIGIHLGDVTVEGEDVFGDGVNIASRLQSIADPGGVYVSESIHHAIRGSTDIRSQFLGEVQLKNVDYLVKTYYLEGEGLPEPSKKRKKELFRRERRSVLKTIYTYLVVLLIAVIAITTWWIKGKSGQDLKAIAVLPVENLSQNSDQEWLEVGIHQALIDEISKIHAFRVVSRRSSLRYRDSDKAIPEIAKELNVDGIVEASFSTSGDNINIHVRLIKAHPEERQIWDRAYDMLMKNVLSIYSDVALSIAEIANISLSPEEEKYLSVAYEINPEAYEAYLRGMIYWGTATKTDLDRSLDYFERAREIDADYPLAYVGIAKVWGGYMQHGFKPASEASPILRKAAAKALELDSSLVEVHSLKALYSTWWDWDLDRAGREFKKAIEINPNYAFALAYYSHYLGIIGRADEGLPYGELAIELDPVNPLYLSLHGQFLKNARKYDEALEFLEDVIKDEPGQGIGLATLWAVYHELGRYDEALETARKIYALKGQDAMIESLEAGYKEGGYRMAMQRMAETLIAYKDTTYIADTQICTMYCRAEMKEEALDWLESTFEAQSPNIPYITVDPLFDFIREEERFITILDALNLPE